MAKKPTEIVSELLYSLEWTAKYPRFTDAEAAEWKARLYFSDDQWSAVLSAIDDELHRRQVRDWVEYLRRARRNDEATAWAAANLHLGAQEQKQLLQEIGAYIEQHEPEALREYLLDVLNVGVEKAEKRRRRRNWGGYFGHAWEVITGVIRIAIAAAALSATSGRFEAITISMLVLLYVQATGRATAQAQVFIKTAFAADIQFTRVRRLLNERLSDTQREDEYAGKREAEKMATRTLVRGYISAGCDIVIWIFAVWKLISTLVG